MRLRRLRVESFGALVATEDPAALVAVDRRAARALGVAEGAWDAPETGLDVRALSAPAEVHLAVTDRCGAGCVGCYADATPDAHEPSFDALAARLDALASAGVFSIAFGGGEALGRDDLATLGARCRALGMTPTLTTSGLGMTPAKASSLAVFAQVNVSHDGVNGAYAASRGFEGARAADRAMRMLREAGVPFGVNTVLSRATFDALEATAAHAEERGAVELQLVRLKPSGRGRLDHLAQRCTASQLARLPGTLRAISASRRIGLRIDCAMIPLLASDEGIRPEDLVRFGVLGCEAGRSLAAVRSDGALAGCSFDARSEGAPRDDAESREALDAAWRLGASVERFRAHHEALPRPCDGCSLRAACRGGCRVVASFFGDPRGPDPECPRVRAFVASRA